MGLAPFIESHSSLRFGESLTLLRKNYVTVESPCKCPMKLSMSNRTSLYCLYYCYVTVVIVSGVVT